MNADSTFPTAFTARVYSGPQQAAVAPAVARTDVVFVADNLTDWATLARGVPEGTQVVVLDSRGNGLQQMADWLATQPEGSVDAVHVLSHGAVGQVQLGSLVLTADNLHTQANALAQIQRSLTEDGDWLLYGCDVAAGAQGAALVQGLALFSRADIAASIDRTGSTALGGNWTLEATRGTVDAPSVQLRDALMHYQNSLSAPVAFTGDTGNTNSPVATFASGTPQSVIYISNTATGDVLNVVMAGTNMFHDTVANFNGLALPSPTGSSGMVFVSQNDNFVNSITLSVQGGKVFDFVSMLLMESNDNPDTFTFTPNGNAAKKVTLSFAANETQSVDLSANTDFDNLSTLTISTADGNFQARFDNIVLENIRAPNAVPTLGGITAATSINDTATATPFSTVTITDTDNVTVSVTLDAAAKGVFTPASLTASGLTSAGGGVYNLASTTAALAQAAIRQLVFDPTDNRVAAASTEATTFTISVNDGVNTAVTNSTTTVTATSVNDAPSLTTVSTLSGASEDTALAITYATLTAAADEADVDPGSTLSFRVEGVSAGNLYTNSGLTTPVTPGTTLLSSGGTWYWKPAADTNSTGGSALNAFTVKAWDGTAASATAIQVKVDVTAINDAPTRTAGSLTAVSVLEDAANSTAGSLGLSALAYGNGGGSDESVQTLAYTVTAIPSFISLFKADGTTAITASSSLTAAELQGLTYKTVANASGTGNLTWTVVDSGGTANGGQNTLTESLAVTVTGVNDAPTRTAGSLTAVTVNENSANTTATTLGLSAVTYGNGGGSDESGQALTYTITAIPAFISLFKADGSTAVTPSVNNTLTAAEWQGLTYKTMADEVGTGSITWTVTDNGGTANSGANTLTESLTFTVNGVPFFSSGSTGSIAENATITTAAYWAATLDAENDVMTYSLGGTDASYFDINSATGKVTLKASADFETRSSYSLQVTASDGMASVSKAITVNVTNVNEAPTNVMLSASTVAENTSTASALTVGALSSTDPDTGSTVTYSIAGGADQASFQISGANLQFKSGTTLNYEAQSSYAVTVRATDQGGLTYDKAFTISLTDVNEAPTVANTIGNQSANATQLFIYQFASNIFADVDTGQTLTYTATKGDGSALPGWLTFTPGTRTFSGTPTSGDAGTVTVKVTATDNGTGSLNTFTTFDIGVAAGPTVSSIVRASAASATVQGSATSVDYTVTFSESVTGVTADDFTVTGTSGASGSVSAVAGSGTTWTVTVNTLAGDGTLRLDLNGSGTGIQNGSSAAIVGGYTSGQTYTLDHTAPTLSISTVATDDKINDAEDESSVSIGGTSSGADGQTVSVSVAGGAAKTATIAAGGAWSVSLTSAEVKALTEGNVSITADVSDTAGNAATQATKTVVYDKTAPMLAISTVATDDKINDTEDESSVSISGTSNGADGQTVSVSVAGGAAKTATIAAGGAWTVSLTSAEVKALTEGNVSITADVSDAAGNAATQQSKTVIYDRTAPTLAISTVATDDKINDTEDESSVSISGTSSGADGQTVSVSVAGGAAKTVTIAAGGAWSVSLTSAEVKALTEGNVSITANVSAAAGNPATQATKTVVYDRTAPTLAISTVATDDKINDTEDESSVSISGTSSGADGQTVSVSVAGGAAKTATIAAGGAWSVSLTSAEVKALTEGNVSITADVSDTAGNAATQATKTVVYDKTAPTLAISTVATDDKINDTEDESSVTVSGTSAGADGQTVSVSVAGGAAKTATIAAGGAWSVSLTTAEVKALTEGNVSITADVSDAAGNLATQATKTAVYNRTVPTAPSAPNMTAGTDTGISTTDDTTSNTTPTFTGTAEANRTVKLYDTDGTTLLGTATADGAGNWSITSSVLGAGVHSLTVKATDAAGNTSVASGALSVTIDTTAPAFVPATSTPADNATTFGISSDIIVKFGERLDASSDLTKVYLKDVTTDTLVPATVTLDADGNIVINPTGNLAYSKAYYAAWDANALKDTAGNAVVAVADETTYNFTTEAEPAAPAPTPTTPPPTTATVDGTTVQTTTTTGTGGTTTTTQTVAPVTDTRREENTTTPLADIPLASDSSGAPTVQISLPVGVGLTSETTSTGTGSTPLSLRDKLINASQPRVDGDVTMQKIIDDGIDKYVPSVGDQTQVTVRTVTLTVAPPAAGTTPTPPSQPIVVRGATGTGEADPNHPLRGEALVIDARNLPPGTVLDLSLVEFAIIIGPSTLIGGNGANVVIGDGSRQFIVLGPDDDILRGGAGDDTIGSKGGDDQLFGDEGHDIVVGGIGNDTLQGGDGNDILQGGASDAGTWNFKLNAQGQLQASFVPTSTELADSTGFSATDIWTAPSGRGPLTDSRFAWVYDNYAVAKDAALLVQALANRLPTLYEMGGVADGTYSSEQLAFMAHDYFARTGTPGGKAAFEAQTLQTQVSTVINQVWGANSATTELVNLGVNHLSGGGSWSNVWLALARYSTNASKITDSQGTVSLISNQKLSDTGWSLNSGADKLFGGAGNDVLVGGNGNDELDGGAGTDMAVWLGAIGDFEAAIVPSTAQGAPAGAHDALIRNKLTGEVDSIRNVELFKIGHTVYSVPPGHPQPADGVFVELSSYVQPVVIGQLAGVGFNSEWVA